MQMYNSHIILLKFNLKLYAGVSKVQKMPGNQIKLDFYLLYDRNNKQNNIFVPSSLKQYFSEDNKQKQKS